MDSFRRELINSQIYINKKKLNGIIADFGGSSKENSRTNVKQIFEKEKIISVNIDKSSNADIISNLENLPIENNYFDSFLLLEVLEHVQNPKKIIREIHRVVKIGSYGFVSMPFLYQIHKAPTDFRRWTKDKLVEFFENSSFDVELITENGGIYSVIYDLFRSKLMSSNEPKIINKFKYYILKLLKPIFKILDKCNNQVSKNITTGYFLIVRKK
jgi:ubiquinone/menaquinone biosynthesis C-methylase UbiE